MKSQSKSIQKKALIISLSLISLNLTSYQAIADTVTTKAETINLPKPYATKSSQNFSNVIGWPKNKTPIAPAGFKVTKYADKLINPRHIYIGPNSDVFISEANTEVKGMMKLGAMIIGAAKSDRLDKSANRITMFRDTNKDGIPDIKTSFINVGLNQPYGMLIMNNYFYIANTDSVWRYPYKTGDMALKGKGQKILDLPKAGRHWVRNLIANKDNTKIYIAVGSSSNVAEDGFDKEIRRADILEINPDGSGEKIYASGLRNPVGMDWAPGTNTLWTAVNERDELGDELVPDYLTSVKEGGFYGWPYSYYGQHIEPRIKAKDQKPELVKSAIVPDVPLGSHTASLGLAFYKAKKFPQKYRNGAFIGQHGSWNKSKLSGYKVVFVPFANGQPSGKAEDFLTGFVVDPKKNKVYGRPVDTCVMPDGSLLVTDDTSNTLWRVSTK